MMLLWYVQHDPTSLFIKKSGHVGKSKELKSCTSRTTALHVNPSTVTLVKTHADKNRSVRYKNIFIALFDIPLPSLSFFSMYAVPCAHDLVVATCPSTQVYFPLR